MQEIVQPGWRERYIRAGEMSVLPMTLQLTRFLLLVFAPSIVVFARIGFDWRIFLCLAAGSFRSELMKARIGVDYIFKLWKIEFLSFYDQFLGDFSQFRYSFIFKLL